MVGKPLPTSLSVGEPVKTVSERLGHASAMITLNVYAHVLPGDQRRAADRFAPLVGGVRGRQVAIKLQSLCLILV
jgi:hypothetical protein